MTERKWEKFQKGKKNFSPSTGPNSKQPNYFASVFLRDFSNVQFQKKKRSSSSLT